MAQILHKRFDWANRIEVSVSPPTTGSLALGETAFETLTSGEMPFGFDAFAGMCRAMAAYPQPRAFIPAHGGCIGEKAPQQLSPGYCAYD
jgi:hypothetical protein